MKFSVKKAARRFGLAAFLFFFIKGLVWLAVFFGAARLLLPISGTSELAVWEASARDATSRTIRFHIVAPKIPADTAAIRTYGRQYLEQKDGDHRLLELKLCPACLPEEKSRKLKRTVRRNGFAVYELPPE